MRGPAALPPEGRPLVFVYGTLKRGFGNHRVMADAGGEFICEGRTVTPLPLVAQGLPFLLDQPGHGHRVEGEVYRVGDSRGWDRLDRLEGHPDFYRRRLIEVEGTDGDRYEAWAYFIAREEALAGLPRLCAYVHRSSFIKEEESSFLT
ncbi:MAG: gamma-glutamylcyclotransferase [Chthoniobacterales bacterium]|nr:gamma-glutamylcyclotransferase [Chthoniobacterales bacterium]